MIFIVLFSCWRTKEFKIQIYFSMCVCKPPMLWLSMYLKLEPTCKTGTLCCWIRPSSTAGSRVLLQFSSVLCSQYHCKQDTPIIAPPCMPVSITKNVHQWSWSAWKLLCYTRGMPICVMHMTLGCPLVFFADINPIPRLLWIVLVLAHSWNCFYLPFITCKSLRRAWVSYEMLARLFCSLIFSSENPCYLCCTSDSELAFSHDKDQFHFLLSLLIRLISLVRLPHPQLSLLNITLWQK